MPVITNSSFPISTTVDLRFRPDSYVADWCALAASVQNVTGEWRRQRLLAVTAKTPLDSKRRDLLLHDVLLADMREAFVAGDPLVRCSGEYLPPYLPGEHEIARIVLGMTPSVVYSLRARIVPRPDGRAFSRRLHPKNMPRSLRMVDEHGTTFTLEPPARSTGTMTLRELIRVIDSVRVSNIEACDEPWPFPEMLRWQALELSMQYHDLSNFVRVSSVVYPELNAFYRARLAWSERKQRSLAARDRIRQWILAKESAWEQQA